MMILQAVSQDKVMLDAIGDDLLKVNLLANVMISDGLSFKYRNDDGEVIETRQYVLKGISKSLLFSKINSRLKDTYGDKMPLLYSEPLIMMDSMQMEEILNKLQEV